MGETKSLLPDYQQLLRDLKGVVEGLLISQVANVWNVYGGLNRLHSAMENIFKHQCKVLKPDGMYDCLAFIQGLNWLQPDITNSTLSVDSEYQPHLPTHLKTDKFSLWLYRSLENHTLSQKLSWLLSDKEHLLSCYYKNAFMCQENYSEAILICLRAIERNEPSLLSEIDPCLFLNKFNMSFRKSHRRCSSFPDSVHYRKWSVPRRMTESLIEQDVFDSPKKHRKKSETLPATKNVYGKIRPWFSMPNLHIESIQIRKRSATIVKCCSTTPSTPTHPIKFDTKQDKLSPSLLKVDYSNLQDTREKSKNKCPPYKKHSKKHEPRNQSSSEAKAKYAKHKKIEKPKAESSRSLPVESVIDGLTMALSLVKSAPDYSPSVIPGIRDFIKRPRKSFIEDGGSSVLPMSTGFFPRPLEGQTLTSFLSSSQFSRTNAELDRENAHFSISEAMIAAIEQIKWKRDLKIDEQDDSDEEINNLKQRIRLRKRQKQEERQRKLWGLSLLSDGKTDTTTTEVSTSSLSTSSGTSSYSLSTDGVDDWEIDEVSNLPEQRGLSMSMASLYSEADLLKRPRGAPDGQSDILSAEGVALSLISRFNEKQLPRASDLEWLVSEKDAPQELLPMPKSWPISPDEYTPLRGTMEWAPPRSQIIFTIHPTPVCKILVAKQNYRCAGCGMKVAVQYASRFRYCEYLGRYFCTGCHTNQLALIPGRVLQKWDFNRYPVSNFCYRLLEQMFNDPLFRAVELNSSLLKKSKNFDKCRKLRLQLFYLKDFIISCRFADAQKELLQKENSYLFTDTEVYSISDLLQIKQGEMLNRLKYLFEICAKHVKDCQLCLARGFICETCKKDDTLFPWQLNTITRCDNCGSCYHNKCWKEFASCLRCVRLTERRTND